MGPWPCVLLKIRDAFDWIRVNASQENCAGEVHICNA